MKMDKKTIGIAMAAVLAALSGGAEVLSLGERVEALEALHPELGVPDSPKPQDGSQQPPGPEPTEEPSAEPESAPEPAEHMELNDDDEWVPVEEATEGEG
jgi:hypothetical protein